MLIEALALPQLPSRTPALASYSFSDHGILGRKCCIDGAAVVNPGKVQN